ncbi:hypothetical protein ABC766_00160 [Methylobacterium fujisawaense]
MNGYLRRHSSRGSFESATLRNSYGQVGRPRFFGGREISEVTMPKTRLERAVCGLADAFDAASASTGDIPAVLLPGSVSQIKIAIIGTITVDMIDGNRVVTVDHLPDETMSQERTAKDPNSHITHRVTCACELARVSSVPRDRDIIALTPDKLSSRGEILECGAQPFFAGGDLNTVDISLRDLGALGDCSADSRVAIRKYDTSALGGRRQTTLTDAADLSGFGHCGTGHEHVHRDADDAARSTPTSIAPAVFLSIASSFANARDLVGELADLILGTHSAYLTAPQRIRMAKPGMTGLSM